MSLGNHAPRLLFLIIPKEPMTFLLSPLVQHQQMTPPRAASLRAGLIPPILLLMEPTTAIAMTTTLISLPQQSTLQFAVIPVPGLSQLALKHAAELTLSSRHYTPFTQRFRYHCIQLGALGLVTHGRRPQAQMVAETQLLPDQRSSSST